MESCSVHELCEARIHRLEEKVEHISNHLSEIDKTTAVDIQKLTGALETINSSMESTVSALGGIQKTMSDMQTTMIQMQGEIKSSNEKVNNLEGKVDTLNRKVSAVDEKDKISVIEVLKKHWFEAVLAAGMAALYFTK